MENKNIAKPSLRRQGVWLLFAKTVGFVFSFLLPLLVVRFLAQDAVGVYRQAFQVISTAVAILPLGVGMSAYYYLSREPARRAYAITNILLFTFAVGGLACLVLSLFPQIIGQIFRNEELTRLAPLIGVMVGLWIFSGFLEIVAVANQEPRLAAAFIILAQLTKTILMVSAVFLFATVESFLYAALMQGILQSSALFVYLNYRFPRFWKNFEPGFFREQLAYALPFGFAGLLWILQTDLHNFFVGNRFSPAEYAIYVYGCFQLPFISMVIESASSVMIPRMSELQEKNDTSEMLNIAIRATKRLALIFFPVYVFLMITAQAFVVTLFTRDYLASVPIFMINLTLLPVAVWINDPFVRAYPELGRFLLILRLFIFVGLVAALYFGVQRFDLVGMILIVIATALIEKVILTTVVLRKLKVSRAGLLPLMAVGTTAICAVFAGLPTYLIYSQFGKSISSLGATLARDYLGFTNTYFIESIEGISVLAVCSLIFVPVYFFSIYALGILEEADLHMLRRQLGRFTGRKQDYNRSN